MYNFLDPKLLPKVTTSTPSMDHFEATNLISDDFTLKSSGFLSYSVIRPPVDLEFELICPVNISFISLITTVGTQKCTGIEIFASSKDCEYVSIGKAFYDKKGVIFCDCKKYSKTQPPPSFNDAMGLFYLNKGAVKVWKNAVKLKVNIFRTYKSVPCLGSIEVYGEPSKYCSDTTKQTLKRLLKLETTPISQSTDNNKEDSSKKDIIPEDFKDALTMELMTIPVTLPSGKTVDQETLDKHNENEASFHRKPGDPFTGLPFTDRRKPVLNVALKSRIDMFLLQNSQYSWTFKLKRTLGSSSSESKRFKSCDRDECACGNMESLYIITLCEHLICKNCLKLKEFKCKSCEKDFKSSNIEKYYK